MAAFFTNLASSGGTYQHKNLQFRALLTQVKSDAKKIQNPNPATCPLWAATFFSVQSAFGPKMDQAFCSQQSALRKQYFVTQSPKL